VCGCVFKGELVLVNTADGVEHCFSLRGKGEKPLPISTITLKMKAGQQCVIIRHLICYLSNLTFFNLPCPATAATATTTGRSPAIGGESAFTYCMVCG